MPFARPTLTQLRDSAVQSVAAARIYDGTTGLVVNPILLQFDPLTIMAKVMAGLTYEEYGYLDWISLQSTPYTATDEAALAWGALVGVSQKAAQPATGVASFTNSVTTAIDIPSGSSLVRSDGVTYATTADVVVPAGGSATVAYAATVAGALGTLAAGSVISLASPIAGIVPDGVVTAATAPGSDIETMDDFRTRYLAQFSAPPHGGSQSDYIEWALAVPGITRAWVLGSAMGPGTVGLYIMLDTSEAGTGGFPVGSNGVSPLDNNSHPRDAVYLATGDQATVANALIPLQPVTALVYVSGPTPFPINVVIASLGAANTAANETAITASLNTLLLQIGTPLGLTIQVPQLIGAILAAAGVSNFALVSPAAAIVVPLGSLPTLGTVTLSS